MLTDLNAFSYAWAWGCIIGYWLLIVYTLCYLYSLVKMDCGVLFYLV